MTLSQKLNNILELSTNINQGLNKIWSKSYLEEWMKPSFGEEPSYGT